jgi:voltage-gated potassium channel
MRALRAALGRRGFGYVTMLTLVVTLAGAAGMYAFESGQLGLRSYSEALWCSAMLMTSIGSEYWPLTGEGRLLCLLLSLFAVSVFGYVTATLATFFIGRDAESEDGEVAGAEAMKALQAEIAALRNEIRTLSNRTGT